MTFDQSTVLLILAALAVAYGAIRFVLLPWLTPRFADWAGKKTLGEGYQQARNKGASIGEAFARGKQVQIENLDRALAKESGVPLEIIRTFRRDHPNMSLQAEVLPDDTIGPRFHVRGSEPEIDGYTGALAEATYRVDGTRIEAVDNDDDEHLKSLTWEQLPENIRAAASRTVQGGEYMEGYPPDESEPYYELHFATPGHRWVVEIEPDGKVRGATKRAAAGLLH